MKLTITQGDRIIYEFGDSVTIKKCSELLHVATLLHEADKYLQVWFELQERLREKHD